MWQKTKTQVAFSLRLGVPLAETLVLGVVARCEGNDHKTCLDYSSQLQCKGWSTSAPHLTAPPVILLSLTSPASLPHSLDQK